jgi:hypothetical protein
MKSYLQAGIFVLVAVVCAVLWSIKLEYGL